MKTVAIIGLGQIGGSMVLALRKRRASFRIIGIERSRRRLRLLKPRLDHCASSWKAAADADLVILSLHFQDIIRYLKNASPDRLMMDVCSGKEKLMNIAADRNLRFLGGHPLAGNEFEGEKGWDENLFEGFPFFLCVPKDCAARDLRTIKSFVKSLGARPYEIDAETHDRFLAATSHFPAFLSLLLAKMTDDIPPIFHGPGFHAMTRLATSSHQLLQTFLESNGANIQSALARFRKELNQWEGSAGFSRHWKARASARAD